MHLPIRKCRSILRLLILLAVGAVGIISKDTLWASTPKSLRVPGFALLVLLWLLCIVLVLWPYKKTEKKAPSAASLIYALLSPVFAYLTAELVTTDESLNTTFLTKLFGPSVTNVRYALCNLLVIAIVMLFFTALTGSLKMGPLLGVFAVTGFAIVNLYVYDFRGIAITASDIASVGTAIEVASGFRPDFYFRVYLALLLVLFWWMLAYRIQRHAHALPSHKATYGACLVGGLAVFALCVRIFILGSFFDTMKVNISYFDTMVHSYRVRGTTLIFARSIQEMSPHKPEGYSIEKVEQIAERYLGGEKEVGEVSLLEVSEQNPNIIVVLDEAFSDLQTVGQFELNEDDMPFLHSLQEQEIPNGTCFVSGLGGRTSNTEFEVLTGMTMGFLPQDSYPFQLYIKGRIPSLADLLKKRGYCEIGALHPAKGTNYRRNVVYPWLGFENLYFANALPVKKEKIRWLVSDATVFKSIEALYEKQREETKAPFFFYTMTIQNHSDYNVHQIENTIWTVGLKKAYSGMSQYMSLIRITDEAFEDMCAYFEKSGEPTVIVFMGDHQPKLSASFKKAVTKKNTYETAFHELYNQYKVPCYYWSNFPLQKEEVDLTNTSANYIQLNLMRLIGFSLTPFQEFLLDLQKEVPAMNGFGYLGADGNSYTYDDSSSPYYEKVQEYLMLCYNDMFEGEKRLSGFFE